jgi:hypothetical protein
VRSQLIILMISSIVGTAARSGVAWNITFSEGAKNVEQNL